MIKSNSIQDFDTTTAVAENNSKGLLMKGRTNFHNKKSTSTLYLSHLKKTIKYLLFLYLKTNTF
jgi:hypothetical protein